MTMVPPTQTPNPPPIIHPKTGATAFAGALVTIVMWVLSSYTHVTMPADVAAALTTIFATGASFFTKDTGAS
jgi:hypothetical protein